MISKKGVPGKAHFSDRFCLEICCSCCFVSLNNERLPVLLKTMQEVELD